MIPFVEFEIKKELGKELVVGVNVRPSPFIREVCRVILTDELPEKLRGIGYAAKSNGDVASWRIEDGVLLLMDSRGSVKFRLNGSEFENDSLYITGDVMGESAVAGSGGYMRCVVYPFKSMQERRLNVAISSHVDYCKETVPRLLRSLRMAGIPDERIVVVVASKEEKEEMVDGILCHYVSRNMMGWTAATFIGNPLFNTPLAAADYWLLLHDTCELTSDFAEKIKEVDVGIGYDMIRFAEDKRHDIGFFRSKFISDIGMVDARPDRIGHQMLKMAKFVGTFGDQAIKLKEKDVYGLGTKRDVLSYSIGVKKYSGKAKTGGSP